MNQPKQIILVRKDLKMPKGKLAAQVAHASLAPILQLMREGNLTAKNGVLICKDEPIDWWLNNSFTKVCLGVPDLETLNDLHEKATVAKIPGAMILDEGRTCFSEPTYTCCSIGPWFSSEIDILVGHLKLL